LHNNIWFLDTAYKFSYSHIYLPVLYIYSHTCMITITHTCIHLYDTCIDLYNNEYMLGFGYDNYNNLLMR